MHCKFLGLPGRISISTKMMNFNGNNISMMYRRVPDDLTETSFRGNILSLFAMLSMGTLFLLETKEYLSTNIETNMGLHTLDDSRIQLNFNITMMDLPCEYSTVDVFSSIGFQKNVTRNIRKFPVSDDGVLQRYEQRNWHQDDVELWDPAVFETIDDLHQDGEDAISLNEETFEYALREFPFLFVKFYTSDCSNCDDFAPTWEALGEIVTDASMSIVDAFMKEKGIGDNQYSDEEYEQAVNFMAPVLVTKVNCNKHPKICLDQKIRLYPTMRIFVNGNAKGDYDGHRTVMELVHWVSHIEAENREPGQLRMHLVERFANERTVRNEVEQEWNDALTEHRAPRTRNITRHPGCQISGHIMVDRAPGKFLIQAQSYGHDIAAHMTNLSHIVHHLSFGDPDSRNYIEENWASMPKGFVRSLHPMDGNVYVTGELHQAYHHHLRIITTEFDRNSKMMKWARDNARRVYRILQNSQLSTYRRHIVPEAKFSYDLSPIAVSYLEISRNWYDYLTGLFAIVGGMFTLFGLMDSSLSAFLRKKSY
mmetsp:Transcript_9915/g.20686  ORF Transcript_9915/g.20686 Transcript_9915/m.20686 type:complete len:537 (-) Transcript_9915:123-1733(-)